MSRTRLRGIGVPGTALPIEVMITGQEATSERGNIMTAIISPPNDYVAHIDDGTGSYALENLVVINPGPPLILRGNMPCPLEAGIAQVTAEKTTTGTKTPPYPWDVLTSTDIFIDVLGLEAKGEQGSVTLLHEVMDLAGQEATSEQGDVLHSRFEMIAGLEATSEQGTVLVLKEGVPFIGLESQSEQGSVGVLLGSRITGQEATSEQGNIDNSRHEMISGLEAFSEQGTVSIETTVPAVTGLEAQSEIGDVSYTIEYRVLGQEADSEQGVVSTVGDPPVIQPIPDQIANLGLVFNYQVIATDANNDPLSYGLTNEPIGMTISDTGVISWLCVGQIGDTYVITVTVDDGNQQDSTMFNLTVASRWSENEEEPQGWDSREISSNPWNSRIIQ